MIPRLVALAASTALAAILAAALPALAHEKTGKESLGGIRPDLTAQAVTGVDPARRQEIFRILQGGAALYDPSLSDHLWLVAGNLAKRDWHPPRVTIQVVVRSLDERP